MVSSEWGGRNAGGGYEESCFSDTKKQLSSGKRDDAEGGRIYSAAPAAGISRITNWRYLGRP